MQKIISIPFLIMALFASVCWASENEGARTTVIQVVDSFKHNIVADKDILSKDPDLLRKRVDDILAPVVDFNDFSKKVMGKYYRRASTEQRTRFAVVTKDTLLKSYGSSLLGLDTDKINVLPLGPQDNGREVKVDVDFQMDSGNPLNISFYMEKSQEGQWMLSNVVINNINFGLTFRKQFSVMMQQNKNDIDMAINAWKDSLSKKS